MVRKAIAKVLTVINMNKKVKARDDFKKKKYTPYDLRQRKTRAFRRRLSKFENTKKTMKQKKVDDNNKPRKFALAV